MSGKGESLSPILVRSLPDAWTEYANNSENDSRACTCHSDDKPPQPCAKQFALSECRLSTQSPTLKPLTDDAVWSNNAIMECNAHIGAPMNELLRLVRAVERAHGIT